MSAASLFLRPLADDEIETIRTIEKAARIRYRALGGYLAQAADGPAIAPERFADGEAIVAEVLGKPVGFVLFKPLDELLYIASVAVNPEAAGSGIGRLLMVGAERRAQQMKVAGLSLTTFRTPPWNGPWFRRQGLFVDSRGTHRFRPPRYFGSSRNLSRHVEARNPLEADREFVDRRVTRARHIFFGLTRCQGLDKDSHKDSYRSDSGVKAAVRV